MLFTIVTPSLNCAKYIANNFDSVRKQGFGSDELEHWVIDGGSKDGTLDILRSSPDVKWISEPDKGLSDAVNKGIQRATGDWIIWLNADDFLADDALKTFLEYARDYREVKIFSGHQTILAYDGSVEQMSPGRSYTQRELLEREPAINQASTFVHREVYQKVGLLDVSIRYAMDYEWLVRAMDHYRCVAIPHVLTFYRRRSGSIMDANMAKHFETFLAVRRRYRQPLLSRAEFVGRFHVYTEPLRRIRWIRKIVRKTKGLFGVEPLHRMN